MKHIRFAVFFPVLMLFVLGCNLSSAIADVFATPTPTSTSTPTPTATATATATSTNTPTPTVTDTPLPTSTPTLTPVPLTDPIVPILLANGFTLDTSEPCPEKEPGCVEYSSGLDIKVLILSGGWIEIDTWIDLAKLKQQTTLLDKILIANWDATIDNQAGKLVYLTTKMENTTIKADSEGHFLSAFLSTKYQELILLIGPNGSYIFLTPTVTGQGS